MSRNSIEISAPTQNVYDVLADPVSYALWVVGNKGIRGYDTSWPAPGSEFHHKVGFGPFATRDKTVALKSEPGRRLVLLVRALPFMRATVSFILESHGSGTRLTLEERPSGEPWETLWNPALDAISSVRNAETLRRLRQIAEVRSGVIHR